MRLVIVHCNDTGTDMVGFTHRSIGGQCMLDITFRVLFLSLLLINVPQKQRHALFAKSLGMSQNRADQQLCTLCNNW